MEKGLWLRLCDGHMQAAAPFVVEGLEEATASAVREVSPKIGKKKKKEETASTQEEIRSEVWNEEQKWESLPLPPELRPIFQDIKAKAEAVASKQRQDRNINVGGTQSTRNMKPLSKSRR